jgi:alkyl sulfatase BDS1-like metallo-beta-lactamase superfamily hydrolase
MKNDPGKVSTMLDRSIGGDSKEVAGAVFLIPGFGNCTILVGADGMAVVDPGMFANGARIVREMRSISDAPVRYIIYTHGHYDHAFGTPAILEDAETRGHAPPIIVGHVNVAKRFARYQKTAGHLADTYTRQFASWGAPGGVMEGMNAGDVVRRARYFPPTLEYEKRIALSLGDMTLECRHGLGETDDHTWIWVPERKVVIGGDLVVSSIPNAGAPFRVQRYVVEWAEALEEMAGLEPEAVISGHGGVFRDDNARSMLLTTAGALRYLEDEVIRRLNEGQWYEEIVKSVDLPEDLKESPYLLPAYGCTTFIVHCVLRRYTGWYDGNPSMLFPIAHSEVARDVVELIGDVDPLLDRARNLGDSGEVDDIQRALHLVDFVIDAGGDKVQEARRVKADLLDARAAQEPSFISRNILESAAVLEREKF